MRRIPFLLLCLTACLPSLLLGQMRPEEAELHLALQLGDAKRTRASLDGSADPNVVDDRGYTALNYAAASPTAEVIAYVVRSGAEYDPQKHPEPPIITAAKHGDYKQGMVLIQSGYDPSQTDSLGRNALYHAAARNNGPFADLLLRNSVRIAPEGPGTNNALHQAAKHNADRVLFVMLKQYGGDPNTTDAEGRTALHYAAEAGHARATQILLSHGAQPNVKALGGLMPLHLAAENGHHQVVSLLKGKGALVMLPDSTASNALHKASAAGHLNVLINLLGEGSETNVPDGNGKFPLQLAAENGHAMACSQLIRSGAAVELAGFTAELTAILKNDLPKLKALVKNKRATQAKAFGYPLLSWAIRSGNPEMANHLMEMGALAAELDKEGMAAVHLAVRFAQQGLAGRLAGDPGGKLLQDGRGRTPAHVAVDCNRFQLLPDLLGADVVKMKDNSGRGLLHAAVLADIPETTLPMLFQAKTPLDMADEDGALPLHLAVKKGNHAAAGLLLDYNAEQKNKGEVVNAQDKQGNTALHYAVQADDTKMLSLLLKAGANPSLKNAEGLNAVGMALEHWSYAALQILYVD